MMKNSSCLTIWTLFTLLALPFCLQAQVSINDANEYPDPSAMLDVQSTDKGMLIPRMTTQQRDAISNPVAGLHIYNLDDHCTDIFDGNVWRKSCALAQYPDTLTWSKVGNFPGTSSASNFFFVINGKGYLGLSRSGNTFSKEIWEYDLTSDTWTQKADFPGIPRGGTIGFSINDKGYLGMGATNFANRKDFWEYDPITDTWTRKADLPGGGRRNAVGFSINDKGYVGSGDLLNGQRLQDFWEYDPTTDTWTQKADILGGARASAVSFVINDKGYVGTGLGVLGFSQDFFAYDPSTDTWSQLASFPGVARYSSVGFALKGQGFIGTGVIGFDTNGFIISSQDFWRYDPLSDTWTQIEDFGGGNSAFGLGFANGDNAYVGVGFGVGAAIWKLSTSLLFKPHALILDGDLDTKIQVEESADEDIIRFDVAGTEVLTIDANGDMETKGAITANAFVGDGSGLSNVADDLGDHTATQTLDLDNNDLSNGGTITATAFVGDGSGLTNVTDDLGNHTATQNLELSGNWLSHDGDNEGMFVDATGKVGIGTNSPGERFNVNGNIRLDGNSRRLVFRSSNINGTNISEIRTNVSAPSSAASSDNPWDNFMQFQVARNNSGGKTNALYLQGDGRVGLGTSEPEAMLHLDFADQGDTSGIMLSAGASNSVIYHQDSDLIIRKRGQTNTLVLDAAGNVGIGTASPTKAKLEIAGSGASYTVSGTSGYYGSGGFNNNNSYSGTFSLYASGIIGAAAYVAHSDMRIKQIEGLSNSEADLETLMQIEVTDYRLLDTLAQGTAPVKKVIAQQVAEVYPQAVTNDLTEVVPDIYQRADVQGGWIMLATNLAVGERVKLISEQSNQVYEVIAVEAHRFQVLEPASQNASLAQTQSVFVFGREVNDFHTVDYEALSMLNVSATQEQQRIIEQQQARIEALEAEKASLQQEMTNMKASFEARLQVLEAMMTESK